MKFWPVIPAPTYKEWYRTMCMCTPDLNMFVTECLWVNYNGNEHEVEQDQMIRYKNNMFYSVPCTSTLAFTYVVSDQVVFSTTCLVLLQSAHCVYIGAGMAGQNFIPSSQPLRLAYYVFQKRTLKLSRCSLKWYYNNHRGWDGGMKFWAAYISGVRTHILVIFFVDIVECICVNLT